jgi:hypothetical protein
MGSRKICQPVPSRLDRSRPAPLSGIADVRGQASPSGFGRRSEPAPISSEDGFITVSLIVFVVFATILFAGWTGATVRFV